MLSSFKNTKGCWLGNIYITSDPGVWHAAMSSEMFVQENIILKEKFVVDGLIPD